MKNNSYTKLYGMLVISFLIMYAVMFLNVDRADHIYLSATRTYMALLMVSPMSILMLVMMPVMYKSKKLNAFIMIGSAMVFALSLTFLRYQVFISDEQYMKAMIPHHSSAILVSRHADLKDPEVKDLAKKIIKSQEREIAEMKQYLDKLENAD